MALGATLLRYRQVSDPQPLGTFAALVLFLLVFALACWGAGAWVPRLLRAGGERSLELTVLQLAGGAATLAGAAFALGAVALLRRPLLLAILLGAAALGVWRLRGSFGSPPRFPALPALLVAAAAGATLLPLPVPSGFYDQLNYHLAFPYHWLRLGRMALFPGHDFSYLPATVGLLFTYALAAAGPWAAQAVHWCLGALAAAAAAALARRLAEPDGGVWAAAVLATTPTVMLTATWASADLGATAFAACAWLAALRTVASTAHRHRTTLLAGLLAGTAAGAKALIVATSLVPLSVTLALVPASGERFASPSPRLRRAGLLLAAAALAVAPWLLRNWLAVGDPLFPLVGSSRVAGATLAENLRPLANPLGAAARFFAERSGALLLGTFQPRGAAGNVGPLYLGLLPLAALWFATKRRREALVLGLGLALGVAAWSLLQPLGRYLLAPLALAAALAGAAFAGLDAALRGAVRVACRSLVAVAMLWGVVGGLSPLACNRAAAALGLVPFEEVVAREVDYWPAARFVNENLPKSARLLLVAEARSLYFDRDLLLQDPFQPPRLSQLADFLGSGAAIAEALRRQGVTHLLFNASEAQRIAALNHRESYFAPRTAAGATALAEFFRDWTETLFEARQVRVLALRSTPASATPRP